MEWESDFSLLRENKTTKQKKNAKKKKKGRIRVDGMEEYIFTWIIYSSSCSERSIKSQTLKTNNLISKRLKKKKLLKNEQTFY